MTANEVAYWQLQESKRHNAVTEGLTADIQESQKQRAATQNSVDVANSLSQRKKAEADLANAATRREELAVKQNEASIKEAQMVGNIVLGAANTALSIAGSVVSGLM